MSVRLCPEYVLSMYSVHTGMYWYILGEKKNAQNIQIQTVDLMHSILRSIQLRYQSAFRGDDIYALYMVYIP
jgi:hypothetical protein